MKESQKNERQKHTFSTPRLHSLAREQKVPHIPCHLPIPCSLRPLKGLVVQSVGIRPSHAASSPWLLQQGSAKFFFPRLLLLLLLIRFSFSFEPTPQFFSTDEPSLAQILTMSLSKRMCESSHFRVHEAMTLVMEESLGRAMSASLTYMSAESDGCFRDL
ncbi:hypothetical protein HDV64DRAFT_238375, partial [Trichoderma sp. TUCIM 5745]